MRRADIAAAIASTLADHPALLGGYLFGSRERGGAHEASDVDVGVIARDRLGLDELDLYVLRRAGDLAFFERERRQELLSVRQ